MAALADATLLALSRISVGTPVTDDTDFTAMTPAQVAAKFELWSRGSEITLQSVGGEWVTLEDDEPAVNDRGLTPCGSFTQLALDCLLTAKSVGVIFNGGGWDVYGNGATIEILAKGTENGLPYVDMKISGTPTVDNCSICLPPGWGFLPAANISLGETVTLRTHVDNVTLGSAFRLRRLLYQVEGWPYLNDVLSTYSGMSKLTATDVGIESSPFAQMSTWVDVPPNVPISEPVLWRQFPILAAKNCYVPDHVHVLNESTTTPYTSLAEITQREVAVWKPFVKVIKATTHEDPGAHQVLYSLSRSADELVEVYRATSTDQITLKIRSGGVDYTKTLGSVADSTAFSVAINVFASFTAASLDGGTVQVLTAPKPSGVLTLESIGCKHDGTLQCGGPIAECNLIHPAVWNAAQLEAA